MPPHLHPRSTATSTLFAGTLLASFVVVAVPHIWPCPRPRKSYLEGDSDIFVDENGRVMRRVRRSRQTATTEDGVPRELSEEVKSIRRMRRLDTSSSNVKNSRTLQEEAEVLQHLQAEAAALEKENARRECPVPKPPGALGRLLGFNSSPKSQADGS